MCTQHMHSQERARAFPTGAKLALWCYLGRLACLATLKGYTLNPTVHSQLNETRLVHLLSFDDVLRITLAMCEFGFAMGVLSLLAEATSRDAALIADGCAPT